MRVDPDGKVFPADDRVESVLAVLRQYMDQIAVRKYGECPIEKSAILPKGITEFLQASFVGDVAPATARQEQFVPQTVCLFNKGYFRAPLRCPPRCHQAGSASPHNNDVRPSPILFGDHLMSMIGLLVSAT